MLSPLELQNKKIVTKKRKYDKFEMDEYLDLIFENYKELYSQNQELQKQVKTLSDGVQYYRSIESTMQKALVLAEKTSKETKDAALLKAEAIEKDANSKAAKIMNEAEQEYEAIKDKCLYLVQQFNQYKMQLKQVASAQLELITSDSFDVYSPELDALQKSNAISMSETYTEKESPAATGKAEPDSFEQPLATEDTLLSGNDLAGSNTEQSQNMEFVPENDIANEIESGQGNDQAIQDLVPDNDQNQDLDFILENDGSSNNIETVSSVRKTAATAASPKDAETASLDKTMVIPDIKGQLKKEKNSSDISSEDELSILTADTIDLRSSIEQVKIAETKGTAVSFADAEIQNVTPEKPQILEPVEETKEAPTLDSLLQNLNFGKKNKKKKGQEEDPFEFLGSVDDF